MLRDLHTYHNYVKYHLIGFYNRMQISFFYLKSACIWFTHPYLMAILFWAY